MAEATAVAKEEGAEVGWTPGVTAQGAAGWAWGAAGWVWAAVGWAAAGWAAAAAAAAEG